MKNYLFFIVVFLFGACTKDVTIQPYAPQATLSHRVSEKEALRQLENVLDIIDTPTRGAKRTVKDIMVYHSTRTRSADTTSPDTLLYIVNFDNDQGYAILAADSRLEPVLALMDRGVYEPSEPYVNDTGLTDADLEDDEKDDFWCNEQGGNPGNGTFKPTDIIGDYA